MAPEDVVYRKSHIPFKRNLSTGAMEMSVAPRDARARKFEQPWYLNSHHISPSHGHANMGRTDREHLVLPTPQRPQIVQVERPGLNARSVNGHQSVRR